MIAALVLALVPLDFDEALRLVGEGRFAPALEAALEESDPLRRAQARLYVLHQAGDLPGALRVGLEGVERDPSDVWLVERTTNLALTLRRADLASDLATHLAAAIREAGAQGEPFAETAVAYRAEADALVAAEHARRRAVLRARVTAGVAGVVVLVVLVALARG